MDKRTKVYQVFESIATTYDKANERISLGCEGQWKDTLIRQVAQDALLGKHVLDVCCGTGDITLGIKSRRPDLDVTGLDFSPAMLAVAKAKEPSFQSIHWHCGDALQLPFQPHRFAAVTISFGLRNTTDYQAALGEMFRVAEPGGRLYCLDSFVPEQPWICPFYTLYFRYIMPFLGGGVAKRMQYQWLSDSTTQFLRVRELAALMEQVGWSHIETTTFLFGSCVLLTATKQV